MTGAPFGLRDLKGLRWGPSEYLEWPATLAAAGYDFFMLCYTFCPETNLLWRHPLRPGEQAVIRRLLPDCAARGIELCLAIHPFLEVLWAERPSETVRSATSRPPYQGVGHGDAGLALHPVVGSLAHRVAVSLIGHSQAPTIWRPGARIGSTDGATPPGQEGDRVRYVIKERFFRLGEDSDIADESGRPVLHVDGRVLTLRDLLVVRDPAGREVARVHRKLIALRPTYEVSVGGHEVAEVRKHLFTPFRDRFTIDVPGPDDLEMTGDLLDHEFTIRRGDRTVATVSKRWLTLRDTYGVDIAPGEDELLILASVLALDLAEDRERERERERR